MARPSNTDARRAQIVAALQRVMADQGYDGASIKTIARAAELSPGLVHYHFANKQEILLELVEMQAALLDKRLSARLDKAETPWDRLDAWIDAHLALGRDQSARAVACQVAIGAEAVRQPEVRKVYTQLMQADRARGEEIIRKLLKTLGGNIDAAPEIALALLTTIEGCYRVASGAPTVVQKGFAAPMTRRLARDLIRGRLTW